MRSFYLAAATAFLVATPVSAQTTDEASLRALNAKWLNAYPANDGKALAEVLADDFVLIAPATGARRNKTDIVTDVSNGTLGLVKMSWRDLKIDVFGATAIVSGVSQFTRKNGETGENRYIDIYAKRNGKWRAVAAQVTRLNTEK